MNFYLVKEGEDGPAVREYRGASLPRTGKYRDSDDVAAVMRVLNVGTPPQIQNTAGLTTVGAASSSYRTTLRQGLYAVDGHDHVYSVAGDGTISWVTDPDTLQRLGGPSAVQTLSAGDGVRALFGVGQIGTGVSPAWVSSQRRLAAAIGKGLAV